MESKAPKRVPASKSLLFVALRANLSYKSRMNDSVHEFLLQAVKRLQREIDKHEATIAPLRKDLEDARRALAAIEVAGSTSPSKTQSLESQGEASSAVPSLSGLTMKELTIKALSEHYKNGATAAQLIEYFASEWGRTDILRSSFSPQLSRLKNEGAVKLVGKTWHLQREEVKENEPPEGGSEIEEAATSSYQAGRMTMPGFSPTPSRVADPALHSGGEGGE
ncbi:hypothetical protein [Roseovarius sp. Pro17]|uniref:hypothetical protein n=1 Tax=Roseovarius sp. Pro17 TaxID=3108175 RepID=UPI002D76D0C8|nr:hypothetical protein [Roseovarius sp. Pro17]